MPSFLKPEHRHLIPILLPRGGELSRYAGDPDHALQIERFYGPSEVPRETFLVLTNGPHVLDMQATGPNGLDEGAVQPETPYSIWLAGDTITGATCALASASANAPVLPPPYDYACRVGELRTDESGNIALFGDACLAPLGQPRAVDDWLPAWLLTT